VLSGALAVIWRPAFLVAVLLVGLLAGIASRRLDVVIGLSVDRAAARLEAPTLGATFGRRARSWDLARMSGMSIECSRGWTGSGGASPVRFRLTLEYSAGFWTSHAPKFTVAGVTTLPEARRLARRIALAAGYESEKVGPRERLEFRVGSTPGHQPIADA
jgi:hypothetical protein